jgi:hypothetical protein
MVTDSLSIAQSSGIADAERAGIELARRMLDRGAAELIGDTK